MHSTRWLLISGLLLGYAGPVQSEIIQGVMHVKGCEMS